MPLFGDRDYYEPEFEVTYTKEQKQEYEIYLAFKGYIELFYTPSSVFKYLTQKGHNDLSIL